MSLEIRDNLYQIHVLGLKQILFSMMGMISMKKKIQFQVMMIMKMIGQISTHKHNSTLLLLEQRFWTEKEMNYEISIQRTETP